MVSIIKAVARHVWMPAVHFPPTRQFHFSHRPIPANCNLKLRHQVAIPSISNHAQIRITRIGTTLFPKVPPRHFGNWPFLTPDNISVLPIQFLGQGPASSQDSDSTALALVPLQPASLVPVKPSPLPDHMRHPDGSLKQQGNETEK